ncbi:9184_t:CDS:1, partial [Racocetra persica]
VAKSVFLVSFGMYNSICLLLRCSGLKTIINTSSLLDIVKVIISAIINENTVSEIALLK